MGHNFGVKLAPLSASTSNLFAKLFAFPFCPSRTRRGMFLARVFVEDFAAQLFNCLLDLDCLRAQDSPCCSCFSVLTRIKAAKRSGLLFLCMGTSIPGYMTPLIIRATLFTCIGDHCFPRRVLWPNSFSLAAILLRLSRWAFISASKGTRSL